VINIVSLIVLVLFFFALWHNSKNVSFSLLFVAIISSLTSIANDNWNLIFIFIAIIIALYNKFISISLKRFIYLFVSWAVFACLVFLSILNGGDIVNIIGKSIKLLILFSLLLFDYSAISKNELLVSIRIFAIFSILSFPFICIYDAPDGGFIIDRFSGFSYDANFFALTALVFLIILDLTTPKRETFLKVILFLFILFSQSWSTFFLWAIYRVIGFKNITSLGVKYVKYLPLLLTILTVSFIYYLYTYVGGLTNNGVDGDITIYISNKLNSLLFRFRAMIGGYEYIVSDLNTLLFGMGSGRTAILFGRVFHNLYFQTLFDHGLIFSLLFLLQLNYALSLKSKLTYGILSLLFLHNMLFDNFYTFIFPFTIFIFSASLGIINDNNKGVIDDDNNFNIR